MIYLLAFSGLTISCEEETVTDEEVVDEELPLLNITLPEEETKVWLTTSLKAEASDNQGITKVEFYLDEKMLGEDTEAPYALDFDTRPYKDGTYVLKVRAFDEAGNQQEATRTVEILNKLIQVNVGENHLDSDWAPEEGWVVIADTDGNTIAYEPLTNNQSVVINRPEGVEGDKISVVIIKNIFFGEGNKALIVDQYDNVSPLTWNMPGRDVEQEQIGTATVSYIVPAGYEKHLESFWTGKSKFTGGFSQYRGNSENDEWETSDIEIQQEPAGMFVMIHDVDGNELPYFAFLDSIKVNDYYTLRKEDFQEMELWQTIAIPESEFSRISVYGKSKNGIRYNIYYDSNFIAGGGLSAYIHQPTFTDFSFSLDFDSDNKGYKVFSKEKPLAQYQFPEQDIEVTKVALDRFSAIVDSEDPVTYSRVEYGNWYDVNGYQHIAVWSIYTDSEDTLNVKQIALPEEIKSKYPELEEHQPKYSLTELKTYEDISSLQDYLEKFSGPNEEDVEYEQMMFFSSYSNGRVAWEDYKEKQ